MTTPVFDFAARDFSRQPVSVADVPVNLSPESEEILRSRANYGCLCRHDHYRTATLRRRIIGASGATIVFLQCDACGAAVGGAMRQKDHPAWRDYPVWDDDLVAAHEKASGAYYAGKRAELGLWIDKIDPQARSAEYAAWCRTSPDWHAISDRVMWRCRGWCEACLTESATVVHHLTYEFGVLPPAWDLRAVCNGCHERLHRGCDEWCAWNMAKVS